MEISNPAAHFAETYLACVAGDKRVGGGELGVTSAAGYDGLTKYRHLEDEFHGVIHGQSSSALTHTMKQRLYQISPVRQLLRSFLMRPGLFWGRRIL